MFIDGLWSLKRMINYLLQLYFCGKLYPVHKNKKRLSLKQFKDNLGSIMYKCLFFSEDNDSYKLILSVSVSNIALCSFAATFRTGAGSHGETGSDKQYEDQYFSFHFCGI